jgi:hypothetical protein
MNDLRFAFGGSGIWGAHAPSRAGDGAIAITNFFHGSLKIVSAGAPKPAREARALPSRRNR